MTLRTPGLRASPCSRRSYWALGRAVMGASPLRCDVRRHRFVQMRAEAGDLREGSTGDGKASRHVGVLGSPGDLQGDARHVTGRTKGRGDLHRTQQRGQRGRERWIITARDVSSAAGSEGAIA